MSLELKKINEDDIPLAIDLNTGSIIYYCRNINAEMPKIEDLITVEKLDALDQILDEYPSIKFRDPYYQLFEKIAINMNDPKIRIMENGNFMPLPLNNKQEEQIQHIKISGQQGSGKSYFAGEYIKLYIKEFPENKIYLFSWKDSDKAYDTFVESKKMIRIKLDESFLEKEANTSALSNVLVIFDDIEFLRGEIKKKVYQIKDELSGIGRSKGVYLITICHLPLAGMHTKTENNELTATVVFPASTKYHSRNLLNKYIGLDPKITEQILNLDTRWVYINKNLPLCMITKEKIELL